MEITLAGKNLQTTITERYEKRVESSRQEYFTSSHERKEIKPQFNFEIFLRNFKLSYSLKKLLKQLNEVSANTKKDTYNERFNLINKNLLYRLICGLDTQNSTNKYTVAKRATGYLLNALNTKNGTNFDLDTAIYEADFESVLRQILDLDLDNYPERKAMFWRVQNKILKLSQSDYFEK